MVLQPPLRSSGVRPGFGFANANNKRLERRWHVQACDVDCLSAGGQKGSDHRRLGVVDCDRQVSKFDTLPKGSCGSANHAVLTKASKRIGAQAPCVSCNRKAGASAATRVPV